MHAYFLQFKVQMEELAFKTILIFPNFFVETFFVALLGFPPHEVIPKCVRLRKHRSGFCEVWDLGDRVETEPHMATCMRTLQLNTHRRVSLRATLQCDMRNMQKLKKANYLKNYYPHSKKTKKVPYMSLHCQYLILWSQSTQMISKLLLWLKGLDIKTCWTKDDI